jgi:NAD(P)-dependent dehydrogenase (short-subunit alcohol dehydrogenase family)
VLFSREGAKLIIVDRTEGVKETAKLVSDAGGTVEAVIADAGSEADVKAFIDKAVSKYGRLDAIWANAGVSGGLVPLAEQTVDHWQEVLRVNLIGPFLAIKHSMPHMIRQKSGSIVCTASVAGLKAGASGHPYGASKAGVISLVQTTAYSLSGTGVRINAVCPGLIETGMTKPVFDRAKERGTQDKIGQLNPLKRASRTSSRRWDCSSPATTPPMSTARRSRSTAASPRRCRIPASRSNDDLAFRTQCKHAPFRAVLRPGRMPYFLR